MKISKIAIAALFAAGLVTASASAGFAADKPEIAADCVEGYIAIYDETGFVSCDVDPEANITPVKPIDSCWETEDGVNVCARGAILPEPATLSEDTPIEPADCMVSTDADGNESTACYDAVAYDSTAGDGDVDPGVMPLDDEGNPVTVDGTLMYQSGVAMPAAGSDNTASNTLAAFGVLVGALGAFGIGISRQKEAK